MKQVTLTTPYITLIVLDYGAIIQKVLVKNNQGKYTNMVVGSNFPDDYLTDTAHLGACVGRFAGRISKARFELDRETYPLYGEHGMHLHGGKEGFGKKYWTIEEVNHGNRPYVRLSYFSKHLEEGYPGNLKVMVTYQLINNNLRILHQAKTDRTTIVNLTNHSYFKLDDSDSLAHYDLQLNCPARVETHENLLPTGKVVPVKGSKYDFMDKRSIGSTTLDTPYVINPNTKRAAHIHSQKSGISMDVMTNQPAVVVYTPPHFTGICFETQNFPDAPNHKNFPSSVLKPGEVYKNESEFKFTTHEAQLPLF